MLFFFQIHNPEQTKGSDSPGKSPSTPLYLEQDFKTIEK